MEASTQDPTRHASQQHDAAQHDLANPPRRLQRACSCASTGESCARCADKQKLQRVSTGAAASNAIPPSVDAVLGSRGQSLDTGTRSLMESRFGQDFSGVRIHSDGAAARSAAQVGAWAYTVGSHIAFGADHYRPDQPAGQMLLAHELTHVVQQGAGQAQLQREAASGGVVEHDSDAEDEADIAAEAISFGWHVNIAPKTGGAKLARAGDMPFLGDAAGGCGICYRGNVRQIGIDAHNQIRTEFEILYPTLLPEFPIQPKKTRSIIRKGIPDLIMPTPTGFKIGEIKPANLGYLEGEAKIQIYQRLLNDRYRKINPGLTLERLDLLPPPPLPFFDPLALDCRQALIVNPSVRGVYGYLCYPPFSNELRKKCRCVGDAPKTGAEKATSKGVGLSIASSGGGAYSAGAGVSVNSNSSGLGTAGVGVTISSDTAAGGTATAGVSVLSGGQAVGTTGAGATLDSSGTSAATAGIGASKSTTSLGAAAAGAGTSTDSNLKGAAVAGKGSVKNSDLSATGVAAKGDTKDASGTASKSDPKGVQHEGGTSAQGAPGTKPGDEADKGTQAAKGTDAAKGTGVGAAASGTGTGAGKPTQGAEKKTGTGQGVTATAGAEHGTGSGDSATGSRSTPAAAQGSGTGTGTGTTQQGGLLTAAEMNALGLKGKPVSRAELKAAMEEAIKMRSLIAASSAEQQALLKAIAEHSPDGEYKVSASQWMEKLLAATKGISAEDIQYLATLNWKPANVTAEDLRKRVLAALAKKPKGAAAAAASQESTSGAGHKEGEKHAAAGGKASQTGQGGTGHGAAKGGQAKTGAAQIRGGAVNTHRVFHGETQRPRDFWFVDFWNFDVDRTAVGDVRLMTIAFFGDDSGIYTYQMRFKVTQKKPGQTQEKVKGRVATKNVVYFDLEGLNDEDWDVAPQGQTPFVLRKGQKARFEGAL